MKQAEDNKTLDMWENTMAIKTTDYTLPDFWASALINDDATGLTDEEHEQLNDWLLQAKPGVCINVSDEPEFVQGHDARGYVLACNCLTITFQEVPNET